MKCLNNKLSMVAISFILAACVPSEREQNAQKKNTLGDLVPIHVSATSDIHPVSTEELIDAYDGLLQHVDNEDVLAAAAVRKADLELNLQDELAAKAEEVGDDSFIPEYAEAIAGYEKSLADFPSQEGNDEVLYMLAKSYDLDGNGIKSLEALTRLVTEYPNSQYMVEAQFRRGDYLFVFGEYKASQDAFQYVVDNGQSTAFYENAVYMHGWNLFKRSFYDPALFSFATVLDRTMPADGKLEGVEETKRALVDDSLRVMGMIFSYLEGPDTIEQLFAEHGQRAYSSLLYEQLGDLYISQQRYQDAIRTFEAYIALNPLDSKAPKLQIRILETMMLAKFYKQAFEKKEEFVKSYNEQSDFYRFNDADTNAYVAEYLYVYIDEVARYYHAQAQKQKRKAARYREMPPAYRKRMHQNYEKAIEYYDLFTVSFPNDPHSPEKMFMIAEAYAEMRDMPMAVKYYERTAYDYGINTFSEEAAYASILGYKDLLDKADRAGDKEGRSAAKKRKLGAQIAFAKSYSFSQYAKPVLLDSIDMMYNEKDYALVIDQGKRFLELKPDPTEKEKLEIWLLISHSQFEVERYAEAEQSYVFTLGMLGPKDKRRSQLIDRIAASVYRQGEVFANEGKALEEEAEQLVADNALKPDIDAKKAEAIEKKLLAVDQFLRVAEISPTSKFRKTAEYDAGAYLLQAEQWERAVSVIMDYRKRYDPKKKDLDITGKLIAAYEGMEMYNEAADELQFVVKNEKDPEKKRLALYLSAEYYEKAENEKRALDTYRSYAHQYPKPFDLAMETRFRLSEMYRKKDEENKRRYWLEKIIVEEKKAGDESTDRSKFLAAYSRNVFAKDYFDDYVAIKLTAPLSKSLPKKKTAMELVLSKYQQVMSYQVQEFTTQSTFYIASVYAQLSTDLLDSERPKGFSEVELEEYGYLLEDQAYPFEEIAIETHQANVENSWNGFYDKWVASSIKALAELMPGSYDKKEEVGEVSDVIY